MFIEQPPWFFRALYPQAIFRMDPNVRAVYLTFDDGPIPEVTPWILDLLEKHHIKATFFMVGDNIRKHPDEYRMVVERGHRIGNHTFNHIRGFEYSNPDYLANAKKVDEIIHSDLFRPPHGHMGFRQYYTLRHHYRIIMWDLVTRDYSKCMRPEQVLDNVKRYVRNGSIITFHDSLKSWNNGNLQYALPRAIEFLKMVGDNIRKHPDEYRMVVERGHRIGNHTFNHIRGFEYSNPDYLANAKKVDEIIHSDLFRPPHGHMGFRQYYTLRHHYRIIMWDLVTRDYSKCMRPEQVLDNVKRYVRNGSIITFHDSLKSWNNGNLQYALPRAIEFLKAEGYEFKVF